VRRRAVARGRRVRTSFQPGHFVSMSIHLDALPVELGAHVALFLDRRNYYKDKSLMALRCVSRACLDAARRVIKSHPLISKDLSYMRARQIKRFGKIFGNGCQILKYCGDDTTMTRIESSLFLPANVEQPEDGVAQALLEAHRRRHVLRGLEVESLSFDPETGELSYVVKIVNYTRWSRSESLETYIEEALDWVISWGSFHVNNVTHGTPRATTEDVAKRDSPEMLEALRQFVVETSGCLRKLSICGSLISTQLLLEICRACPQLKEIELGKLKPVPNVARADVDDFAAALSRACPLLESVEIRRDDLLSPAETYAMHFPNLKCLDLNATPNADSGYAPTRFDKIEASVRQCVGAEELNISYCTVPAALAERLNRRPLQSRIKCLLLMDATISQSTLLQLAASLEVLKIIVFPDNLSYSPEFFTSLARARPSLKELSFGDGISTLDDACVAAIFENFELENIQIENNHTLTRAAVDLLLRTPTAETLSGAIFRNTSAFTSAVILRLVRGCPRLAELNWREKDRLISPLDYDSLDGTLHGKNVEDLIELLKERCRGHAGRSFYIDPFKKFGPWRS
jgi:hypothetical protein